MVGELEPKPGIPPSPGHLAEIVAMAQRGDVKLLLVEPFYEKKGPPVRIVQDRGPGGRSSQLRRGPGRGNGLPGHAGQCGEQGFGRIEAVTLRRQS